jgi:hypothetical protein
MKAFMSVPPSNEGEREPNRQHQPTGGKVSLLPKGALYEVLDQTATSATYPVRPATASGYMLELLYPGPYGLDGATGAASGGFCTRKIRTIFTN